LCVFSLVLHIFVTVVSAQVKADRPAPQEKKDNDEEASSQVSKEIAGFCRELKIFSSPPPANDKEKEGLHSLDEMHKYFADHHKEKARKERDLELEPPSENDDGNEGNPKQNEEEEEEEEEEEDPDRKKSKKRNVKEDLCFKITERVANYVSADSPKLRSLSLDLIFTSLPVLAAQNKKLLPLAHKMWPVVVKRLADPEIPVVLSAILLLRGLLSEAKDFLQRRMMTDVWPVLKNVRRSHISLFPRRCGFTELHYHSTSRNRSLIRNIPSKAPCIAFPPPSGSRRRVWNS